MRTQFAKSTVALLSAIVVCAIAFAAPAAQASTAKKTAKKKSVAPITSAGKGKALKSERRLSRDIVFDGANVNGQYHSAGEAVAKVEQEKKMNELVGFRRDFKDRLTAERERLKRGEAAAAQ